ncbi:MAG: deoxyribodipyrimidine photo-lyase, partial [Planctomycetota bacterium]
MRSLMWFRSDLRVADNTALRAASEAADRGVVAVFTACPQQWREHDWGDPRIDFVWRNLRALHEKLSNLNIPLHVLMLNRFSDVPRV